MKMKINTQPSNVYTLSHSKIQNCDLLSVLWLLPLLGGCSCWPPLSIGLQRGHISPPGCNMWSHLVRQQHKSLLLDRPEQFLSYNTLYMCWIYLINLAVQKPSWIQLVAWRFYGRQIWPWLFPSKMTGEIETNNNSTCIICIPAYNSWWKFQ